MIYAKLIAGAVLAGVVSWGIYSVYDAVRDRGFAEGVAATQKNERDCIEGSVCADAAISRAAVQAALVIQVREKAKAEADAAAAAQLEQETEAREAAESRASAASAAARAAERRYQAAIAGDQACAEWSARRVPCPIE